jgi:hypothetical protein
MLRERLISKASRDVLMVSLLSTLFLVPLSAAQFRVSDNFNRAEEAPGLGWSRYGNGAEINSNQLETFGEIDTGGGIQRNLDVTFPLNFSFDFRTDAPSDGGWLIAANAANTDITEATFTGEVMLYQFNGARALCVQFQTNNGVSQECGSTVSGQRYFTAQALISGTLNADFSATVKIKYNDGQLPATVTLRVAAPRGALQTPMGNIFYFGNSNETYGPHFFDNFALSLP